MQARTDLEILRDGLKLARRLGQTSPLKDSLTAETSPGPSVQSDDDWDTWIASQASTEFHPSSSCAMLPREQGGVVDANLRVYGLANVRVADASVPPIALSTHLMASTYGLAEQASDIIRAFYNAAPAMGSSFSSHSSTSENGTNSTSAAASSSVVVRNSTSSGTQLRHGSSGRVYSSLHGFWVSFALLGLFGLVL